MINLLLNHGAGHEGVYLRLPATPGDIGAAFGMLDQLGTGSITIFDVECPVPNVRQYIMNCDVNDKDTFEKLQELAKRISTKLVKHAKGSSDVARCCGKSEIDSFMACAMIEK